MNFVKFLNCVGSACKRGWRLCAWVFHSQNHSISLSNFIFRDSRQDHTDYEPLITETETKKSTSPNDSVSGTCYSTLLFCLSVPDFRCNLLRKICAYTLFKALGFIICCFAIIYIAAMMTHIQCDPGFICKNPRFEWKHPVPFSARMPNSDEKL